MTTIFRFSGSSFIIRFNLFDMGLIRVSFCLTFAGFLHSHIKAEVHLKAVSPPLNIDLTEISRLRLKKSKNSY